MALLSIAIIPALSPAAPTPVLADDVFTIWKVSPCTLFGLLFKSSTATVVPASIVENLNLYFPVVAKLIFLVLCT